MEDMLGVLMLDGGLSISLVSPFNFYFRLMKEASSAPMRALCAPKEDLFCKRKDLLFVNLI